MGCHDKELSILITDDKRIARLNERYLERKGPTNVLAFPMLEDAPGKPAVSNMLGDVVVSLDTARRESALTGETLAQVLDRLLIHGLLHLLGYDHERSEKDARKMAREEARVLELLARQGGSGGRRDGDDTGNWN